LTCELGRISEVAAERRDEVRPETPGVGEELGQGRRAPGGRDPRQTREAGVGHRYIADNAEERGIVGDDWSGAGEERAATEGTVAWGTAAKMRCPKTLALPRCPHSRTDWSGSSGSEEKGNRANSFLHNQWQFK